MIRLRHPTDSLGDVVPQAIFWRPLPYFTLRQVRSADDLDEYWFCTFLIGNWLRFDLRRYAGHPADTVSLYLPLDLNEPEDVQHAIRRVIAEFRLPNSAVAWRRGEPFKYGHLQRTPRDRLREPEARLLVLKVAVVLPNRAASTDELIRGVSALIVPSELDLQPSRTRQRQPQWHQIIRNVISHGNSPNGPFALGLAQRTRDGLEVTDKGLAHLRSLGYVD